MNWKRSWILTASIISAAALASIVYACADGPDPYDEYPSFFVNTVTNDAALLPFSYTTLLAYYDEWYDYDEQGLDKLPDYNALEWQAYCKGKPAIADIDSAIYAWKKDKWQATFDKLDKNAALPADIEKNSLVKYLLDNKDKEAIAYLLYAKRCEPYTEPLEGYWDRQTDKWTTPLRDTAAMHVLADEGAERSLKSKGDFLKQRYAYQALRMAFYGNQYDLTLNLYTKLIDDKKSSGLIYNRCLGMKAGALYRLGRKVDAAYLYSRVFDLSDELKEKVHISFNWAVGADTKAVLALCRNDHEKAVVYIMDGLYESEGQEMEGLELMQKAYAADPSIRGLDFVMIREINKAEQNYMADNYTLRMNYTSFPSSALEAPDTKELLEKQNKYKPYLDGLNSFAQKVAKEGKNGHPAFWHLASSYISFIEGNMSACRAELDIANSQKLTEREKDLAGIINALYLSRSSDRITPAMEAQMLPSLQWIEQRAATVKRFEKVYRDLMTNILATTYLKQGDTGRAIFCYSRVANEASTTEYTGDFIYEPAGELLESLQPERLHAFEEYVARADKSPYEKWLTRNNTFTMPVLRELEGTKYIRLHQFDKAVNILGKKPEVYGASLPDPFIMHIDDQHDLRKIDTQVSSSKLAFAKKMLEQQQKLAKNPNDPDAAYFYAAGLYNMSYYGRASHAFDYYRGGWDEYSYFDVAERSKLPDYYRQYYDPTEAEKYFLVAIKNAKDPEQKAKCTYMAAKCWQKRCPGDSLYVANSWKNPYFRQLKDQYGKTNFYKIAFNTCTYFSSYVKKGK
ncbi:MAG: hypothetical protein JSS82_05960 [Bacteroidetes bacterium]|nr:hypothetical protein [Bacteroidota bacterium]